MWHAGGNLRYYYYSTTTILCPSLDFVWDYPGEPVPEREKQSGFTGARDSE